jgi:iron complex outermembrane receptor protein
MISYKRKVLPASVAALVSVVSIHCVQVAASEMLEEVVVTAQKREQSLQDVGISVTAFTGDQMNALGFTNTVDIALQTPGFTVQAFNPTFTYLNIRGISAMRPMSAR